MCADALQVKGCEIRRREEFDRRTVGREERYLDFSGLVSSTNWRESKPMLLL